MAKIGIYNPNLETLGGGERKTAAMAEYFSRHHDVSLISHSSVDLKFLGAYFDIDLTRVKLLVIPDIPNVRKTSYQKRSLTDTLQSLTRYIRLKAMRYDIFINNYANDFTPNPSRYGIYMCMFPTLPSSEASRSFARRLQRVVFGNSIDRIRTYCVVTANSQFTGSWIKKWWKVPPTVVYTVPQNMGRGATKEKLILNVGRFTAYGGQSHLKRQEIMLQAFIKMLDLQESGWELHFAGSIENTPEGARFLDSLKEQAIGFPVYFHCNASFLKLQDLYRRSAIYWHATGFGTNPDEFPSRQEHLGMTIIEAMSAACVPVVIKSGGLRETVIHERTGFLWNDLEELEEYTRHLVQNPSLRERMSTEAAASFSRFSSEAFFCRMDRIVDTLLEGKTVDPNEYPDIPNIHDALATSSMKSSHDHPGEQ